MWCCLWSGRIQDRGEPGEIQKHSVRGRGRIIQTQFSSRIKLSWRAAFSWEVKYLVGEHRRLILRLNSNLTKDVKEHLRALAWTGRPRLYLFGFGYDEAEHSPRIRWGVPFCGGELDLWGHVRPVYTGGPDAPQPLQEPELQVRGTRRNLRACRAERSSRGWSSGWGPDWGEASGSWRWFGGP